jgi:lysylphosphatidylglycerol synthetase-like protein (DUF2156 family)
VNYTKLLRKYFGAAERRRIKKSMRTLTPRLVNSMLGIVDLQQGLNEYLFHQGAIIRRQAQVLEGTTGKVGFFFEELFGSFAAVLAAFWVVLLLSFLHQHHHSWVQPWMGIEFEEMIQRLPRIGQRAWFFLFVIDIYLCITCVKMRNKFSEREERTKR